MFNWNDYGNGIYGFDSGYVRPLLAAIHLIVEGSRCAIIDNRDKRQPIGFRFFNECLDSIPSQSRFPIRIR